MSPITSQGAAIVAGGGRWVKAGYAGRVALKRMRRNG